MKNIDKRSLSKQKDDSGDTLIYIFLFLLIVLLIGGIGWWIYDKYYKTETIPEKNWTEIYKKKLGEKLESPLAKEVSNLIATNRNSKKRIDWVLDDRIKDKKLTDAEKEEVRAELAGFNENLDTHLQGQEIKKMDDSSLKLIFDMIYEQGKILVQIEDKISVNRNLEEVKKQQEEQEQWKISPSEKEDIDEKMNTWITGWYNQAMAQVLKPGETKLTEFIRPAWVKGRWTKEGETFPDEIIAPFRKVWGWKNDKGETGKLDLTQPLKVTFEGYDGFLTQKNKESSEEGKQTMGVTVQIPSGNVSIGEGKEKLFAAPDNHRRMIIQLKEELFFSRLGYEEWISEITEKKDGTHNRTYTDISFAQVTDTIVHELAHAVVCSIKTEYDGEEGGGHGALFYDMMRRIDPMLRATPEFAEFEQWWYLSKE